MTIEIALLISLVSVVCSVVFGFVSMRRSSKADTKQETSNMTTVLIRLENISDGVKEIKSDFNAMKHDVKELNETLIKTVASLDTAWKRIDELKNKVEVLSK